MNLVESLFLAAARYTMSVAGQGLGTSINDGRRAQTFGRWLLARHHPGHADWCNLNSLTTTSPTWCSCEPSESVTPV